MLVQFQAPHMVSSKETSSRKYLRMEKQRHDYGASTRGSWLTWTGQNTKVWMCKVQRWSQIYQKMLLSVKDHTTQGSPTKAIV
jgi:hypothetical protein